MAVTAIACMGILFQIKAERPLDADLPFLGWRQTCVESSEIGILEMIRTWNARANPKVPSGYVVRPDSVLNRIDQLDIDWAVGSAWDRLDLPQNNNRTHTHPPGMVVFLGSWIQVFGPSTYSVQLFVLTVKCALLILAYLWIVPLLPATASLERTTLLLALATAPPILLHPFPANNEIASLLSMLGIAMVYRKRALLRSVCAGGFLGLASYTQFFNVYLLFFVLALSAFSGPIWRNRRLVGLLIGMACIFAVFTVLGYYPWLTYLTGAEFETHFRSGRTHDFLTGILEYAYLGIPLALLSILSVWRILCHHERDLMLAIVLTLLTCAYHMFGYANGQRYLIGFVFMLTPILAASLAELKLSHGQAYSIPLAGLLFTALVTLF